MRRPKVIPCFNVVDIEKYYQPNKRGVLVKHFDQEKSAWNVYKLDFEHYTAVKRVRGNVPQIRMRFLELLNDSATLVLLEKYYPEHRFMFSVIKNSLRNVTKTVYKLYVDSHIKHHVTITDESMYYRTLRQLHAQYKTTNKPITFDDVERKVLSLDKHVLKKFLSWV